MHQSSSKLAYGTLKSPQQNLQQEEYGIIEDNIEQQNLDHQYYLTNELPKSCPISIPSSANILEQEKNGYIQVKYSWKEAEYNYNCRWHTKTPNAPSYQGASWVIERKKTGVGYGPNARKAKYEILVKEPKSGNVMWVEKKMWQDAIAARKKGNCTQEQKELLDNGHFKA